MNRVIVAPIITEKSMKDAGIGKFSFIVDINSTKTDIKKVIEKKFAVSVTKVYTTIQKGRSKRDGKRREEIKLPNFKKAQVILKKGEKIGIFDLPKE